MFKNQRNEERAAMQWSTERTSDPNNGYEEMAWAWNMKHEAWGEMNEVEMMQGDEVENENIQKGMSNRNMVDIV